MIRLAHISFWEPHYWIGLFIFLPDAPFLVNGKPALRFCTLLCIYPVRHRNHHHAPDLLPVCMEKVLP